MRVWDIHPGYLSRQNLLGQHVEIHAVCSVITGRKKGYAAHPEILRWVDQPARLRRRHDLTVREMALRGYKHASTFEGGCNGERVSRNPAFVDPPARQVALLEAKYARRMQRGRIPLPKRGSDYWAHHAYSLMARGSNLYRDLEAFLKSKPDKPIAEENDFILAIISIMELQVNRPDLEDVLDRLWACLIKAAAAAEKEYYQSLACYRQQLDYLYHLAVKYDQNFLQHSTVFTESLPDGDPVPS
ncbi:MAG: pyrimidine dimer DNA glycosylase/endonuclease V [Bacillota bacterium]